MRFKMSYDIEMMNELLWLLDEVNREPFSPTICRYFNCWPYGAWRLAMIYYLTLMQEGSAASYAISTFATADKKSFRRYDDMHLLHASRAICSLILRMLGRRYAIYKAAISLPLCLFIRR